MTTRTNTLDYGARTTSPNLRWLLVAIALIAVGTTISHAIARHGEIVQEIRTKCSKQGDPQWINELTGRGARWCILREPDAENGQKGKLGYQIMEKVNGVWEEITAFPQKVNVSQTIEEAVAKYMNNTGYTVP